ncbi:unnamed protein product, partial [Symbiodinium pilosum]
EDLGVALFVSHQWLADSHPDPKAEQLAVLQDALTNIISGRSRVRLPVVMEMVYGRLPTPDLRAKPLYIWYDYFCCPQGNSIQAFRQRQSAIDNIVSYISRCKYFVVLCPSLTHMDRRLVLDEGTWAQRGWCRMERLGRELAVHESGAAIVIESGLRQYLMFMTSRHLDAPGDWKFLTKVYTLPQTNMETHIVPF